MGGGGVGRLVNWGDWLSGAATSPWVCRLRVSKGMADGLARCWGNSRWRIEGSSGLRARM